MKRTIITFPSGNTAVRLEPEEGYKYVTNGEAYSEMVTIGKNANESDWHDTNDDPPSPEDDPPITPEQIISRLEEIL